MCGRYYETEGAEVIKEAFGIKTPDNELPIVDARYNIAPMQFAPVVRINPTTKERELVKLRWGLIPSWSKDEKFAASTINAMAETVDTKPTYRDAFKKKRCLVPASGFFEWMKFAHTKDKQPYKIFLEGEKVFAFAGLWESWQSKETGMVLETFTIITCEPNELVMNIHNRMPVIIAKENWDVWLSGTDLNEVKALLRPYPEEGMGVLPVSRAVGNVKNDNPGLIDEIDDPILEP